MRSELTEDIRVQLSLIEGYVLADDDRMYSKESAFSSLGTNQYVKNETDSKVSYFPVNLLKSIGDK